MTSLRRQVESPVRESTLISLHRENPRSESQRTAIRVLFKSQCHFASDIRLNFFPTTAEGSRTTEQRTLLNKQQLLVTRPNSRVVQLVTYNSLNNKGVPHQIYCLNDDYNPRKGKPICLYNGVWHALLHKKGKFAVGQELPEVHDYNILEKGKAREEEPSQTAEAETLQEVLVEEGFRSTTDPIVETPPDSPTVTTESQESTTLATQLRLAPVPTSIKTSPIASPLMTTTTQTYMTRRRGGTPPPPFSGPPRAGSPAPPPPGDGWGGEWRRRRRRRTTRRARTRPEPPSCTTTARGQTNGATSSSFRGRPNASRVLHRLLKSLLSTKPPGPELSVVPDKDCAGPHLATGPIGRRMGQTHRELAGDVRPDCGRHPRYMEPIRNPIPHHLRRLPTGSEGPKPARDTANEMALDRSIHHGF